MSRDLRARGLAKATKPFNVATFAGKQHRHGCQICARAYTDACLTPFDSELCTDCRQGRATFIMAGWAPKACCDQRKKATNDQRTNYKLAGSDDWWLCPTCARQFTSAVAA